jgi:hypothetical protein
MVFGSLFKPKGTMVLQSPDKLLPGGLVPFEIRITAGEELKPRELRAELDGEETYYVTETHHGPKGQVNTHTVQKNEKFASIVQTVAEAPSLSPGAEQKWNGSLQLPADALPTSRGKLVDIRWTLKAVLDVPKRADLSQEKSLVVLCPSRPSDTTMQLADKIFGEVTLVLTAPPAVASGDTLKGQLALQIKDKLSFRAIRLELVQVEDAGSRKGDEVISKTQISGDASFNQMEAPSFNFSIDVPVEAAPTVAGRRSALRWKLKAVIDRKLKSDFTVEQELIVYNRPTA